jgi:hypothetical protein
VCPAVVCAAAVLMVAVILLLPLGRHRFEEKTSHSRAGATLARGTGGAATDQAEPAVRARMAESYGKLPLSFEVNKGQTDRQVKFLSRGCGYSLFLTGNEAVLALRKSNSNGKKQMAKGKNEFQRSPFDGPRALLQRPASLQFPVSNFQTPATSNEPRTTDAVLHMKLVGANERANVTGIDEVPGKSNYFIGNDPKKWRTNVPNYARVKYANVYPGVDLVYYGNQGKLEYDFVVQPGADPQSIQLAIVSDGQVGSRQKAVGSDDVGTGLALPERPPQAAPLHVSATGDLVVGTDGGEVIFHKPVIYQPGDNRKSPAGRRPLGSTRDKGQLTNDGGKDYIDGRYVLRGGKSVAFQVGSYDPAKPLVIDPVLTYSTYLGGSGDEGVSGIASNALGEAYVTGGTGSLDFPATTGAFQTSFHGWGSDAYVSKLNTTGSSLLYSTYVGADGTEDGGASIAVDASGNAYVTGSATAIGEVASFPGCGSLQPQLDTFAFVFKLKPDGSALVYSTCLPVSTDFSGRGNGIAIDVSGDAYVVGTTDLTSFPTVNPLPYSFPGRQNAFVAKLNATGSVVYSTLLGGTAGSSWNTGDGIAADASGNAYVAGTTACDDLPMVNTSIPVPTGGCGQNAFVSKLSFSGSKLSLAYSTYLGGSCSDGGPIALDSAANAYVAVSACSHDFPLVNPLPESSAAKGSIVILVVKLSFSASLLSPVYMTYLGGNGRDDPGGIAVDGAGNAYVTGDTSSTDFPTTPGAFQTTSGASLDVFLSELSFSGTSLSLAFSTYLAGWGRDFGQGIAVDGSGNIYVAGLTESPNFPTTPGAFQMANPKGTTGGEVGESGFVAKISSGDAAGLAVAPGGLTFAPQAVGTTSWETLRLIAAGSQSLDIASIVTSGDFSRSSACLGTIQADASCTLTVSFTPTATGTRSGALTVTDNAAGSPHKLLLTGTGGIPLVTLTPTSLTFASQAVGTTSAPLSATLTNTGSGPLSITRIARTGTVSDFTKPNTYCPTVLPGQSCVFSVAFKPTATGARFATITITDDAPGSPQQLFLIGPATGTGGSQVSLTPSSLTFGAQPVGTVSSHQVVTLKNIGGTALNIAGIARWGDFYEGNNCPTTLLPGASCTLSVTFTPSSAGTTLGALTILDNVPDSPHSLPLSGTGIGSGSISLALSPPALTFGSVLVGSTSDPQTVAVTNIGTVAASFLYPLGFKATGDFHEQSYCGTSLAPKASCMVTVTFEPTAIGTGGGIFRVKQGAASAQIPLIGNTAGAP